MVTSLMEKKNTEVLRDANSKGQRNLAGPGRPEALPIGLLSGGGGYGCRNRCAGIKPDGFLQSLGSRRNCSNPKSAPNF